MNDHHKHFHKPSTENKWLHSTQGLIALLFLAGIGFFLITEHMAHIIEYLPYLIVLACPLMHIFMHGKHGHGHSHNSEAPLSKENMGDKQSSPIGLILVLALIGFGYYLVTEHKAHLLQALPLLLIVGCCIAMHLIMHRAVMHMEDIDKDETGEK